MNDQTSKLIEQLAQKLGTTTQYLWSILLKQAPISAGMSLFFFVLVVIAGILIYGLHKRNMKVDEKGNNTYDNNDDFAFVPMVFLAILWVIAFALCLCFSGNIITGFFNPEYWALNQILDSVR